MSNIEVEKDYMYEAKLRFTKKTYIINASSKREVKDILKGMGKNPFYYTITKVLLD